MSNTIEEQVLAMRFDNAQFESGVKTSISTLDKLKSALKLDQAAEGLSQVGKAASSMALEGIADSLGKISNKFTVFGTIGDQVIRNITTKVMSLTGQFSNLLTSMSPIGQMGAGWGKYEEKTKSVQTIMNATGKSIEEVESELAKLMWFSDETSYSFTDMTSNVGKFTSQGIDLGTATTAMMGIANAAALAGAGSGEASRAMYNISQAMGAGYMKLMDWKSIENANMATEQFKQSFIEAGLAMGTLVKQGDKVMTANGKAEVSVAKFSTTLSEGWMNQQVMLKGLEEYGEYAEEVYKVVREQGISCAEAMELVSDQYMQVGAKAFRAAQEAKTFSDMVDATKDAVSSQWSNIFQNLFGNYEEAKVFWTDWSLELWDIFAGPLDAINGVLTEWHANGGYSDWIDAIWAAWGAVRNVIDLVGDALDGVLPKLDSEGLINWTSGLKDGAERLQSFFAPLDSFTTPADAAKEAYQNFLEMAEGASYSAEEFAAFQEEADALGVSLWQLGTQKISENVKGFDDIAKYIFGGDADKAAASMANTWAKATEYNASAEGQLAAFKKYADSTSVTWHDILEGAKAASEETGNMVGPMSYLSNSIKENFSGLEAVANEFYGGNQEKAALALAKMYKSSIENSEHTADAVKAQYEAFDEIANSAVDTYEWMEDRAAKLYPKLTPEEAVLQETKDNILKYFDGLDEIADNEFNGDKYKAADVLAKRYLDTVKENDAALAKSQERALAFQNVITQVASVAKAAAEVVGSVVTKGKEIFGTVREKVFESFTKVFGSISDLDLSGTVEWLGSIKESIEGFSIDGLALSTIIDTFTVSLIKIRDIVTALEPLMSTAISAIMNSLPDGAGILNTIVGLIAKIGAAISRVDAASVANKIATAFRSVGLIVGNTVSLIWSGITKAITLFEQIGAVGKKAFEQIFPKSSSNFNIAKIINIIQTLKQRIDEFQLSGESLESIQSIFRGLFAVVDIGKSIFDAFIDSIKPLFSGMSSGGAFESILTAAGKFGELLVKFRDSAKDSDIFHKIFTTLSNGIQAAASIIGPAVSTISSWIGTLIEVAGPIVSWLISSASTLITAIGNIFAAIRDGSSGNGIGQAFSGLFGALGDLFKSIDWSSVGTVIVSAATNIVNGLTTLVNGIKNTLGEHGIDASQLMSGGFIGLLIAGLIKLASTVRDVLNSGGLEGLFKWLEEKADIIGKKASKMLEPLTGALESLQTRLKAESLEKLAIAIGVIAGSILVLSFLDSSAIAASLAAITAGLVELGGVMFALSKFGDATSMKAVGSSMIGMAAAILILAIAMRVIAKIDPTSFTQAILGVMLLMGSLTAMAIGIDKYASDLSKVGGTLLAMGFAILILAGALKLLSTIDIDSMGVALFGLVIGLAMMAGVLAGLTIIADNNGAKHMLGAAASMAILAVALIAMGVALKLMSTIDIDSMGVALLGLVGGLMFMAAAIAALGMLANSIGSGKLLAAAGALLIVSVALVAMSVAMKALASIKLEDMGTAILGLAVGIGVAVVAIAALSAFGPQVLIAAAALLVFSVALLVLAPALTAIGLAITAMVTAMSSLSFGDIVKAILKLVVAFVGLTVAAVLMVPALVVLTALTMVMALFTVALSTLVGGLTVASIAMASFASVASIGVKALVVALSNVLYGIVSLGTQITAAISMVILSVVQAIVTCVPAIVNGVVTIIMAILQAIQTLAPAIIQTVVTVILALLQAIQTLAPAIVQTAVTVLLAVAQGLSDNMPTIINAGINLMTSFINGMADGLRNNTGTILGAVGNLLSSIIEFILSFAQNFLSQIPGIGGKISDALESAKGGIHDFFTNAASDAEADGEAIGTSVANGFSQSTGSFANDGKEAGAELVRGLKEGADAGGTDDILPNRPVSREKYYYEGYEAGTVYKRGEGLGFESGVGIDESIMNSFAGIDFTNIYDKGSTSAESFGTGFNSSMETFDMDPMAIMNGDGELEALFGQAGTDSGTEFTNNAAETISANSGNVSAAASTMAGATAEELQATTSAANEATAAVNAAGAAASETSALAQQLIVTLSDASTNAREAGVGIVEALTSGITSMRPSATNATYQLGSTANTKLASFRSSFKSTGVNLIQGLIEGMRQMSGPLAQYAYDLGQSTVSNINKGAGVASPSKLTMASGNDLGRGLIIGIRQMSSRINDTAYEAGNIAVVAMQSTIDRIRNIVDGTLEVDPTIRPVLDMSSIDAGAGQINSMFGTVPFSLSGINSYAMRNVSGISVGNPSGQMAHSNADVVNAIREMRYDIDQLGERISQMKVVMDSGELVGSIGTKMDRRLGEIAKHKLRGN